MEWAGAVFLFYLSVFIGILTWRRHVQQQQREYETKLLQDNPEAWERMKRVEMEEKEKKKAALGKAGMTGLQIAWHLLKRR